MQQIKILQVIDRLDAGGAERVMVDLSNILNQYGHKITTLTILDHGELGQFLHQNIDKVALNRPGRFSWKTMRKLSREANKNDIIHVHMRHNLKYVWLVNKLFPIKAKLVFHDHYGKIGIDKSVDRVLSWALKNANYIGVSSQLADWAIQNVRLPSDKVDHLANIIIQKTIAARSKNGSTGKKLVLVSNIRREKNIEFAIRLMGDLVRQHEVDLTIYGKIVDNGYFQEISALVSSLQLSENVTFVNDCLDLQGELYKFDLAIHTAKSETGPLVLIEYMAQGLPFVTYNTGEVVDQIKGELEAFVLPHFSTKDWEEKIIGLWDKDLTQKVLKVYQNHYSVENYYQKCLKIYQKTLTCS